MFLTGFEQEEYSFKQSKTTKAMVATLLLHGGLLLGLFFYVIHVPIPPFPEQASGGVEVNFGFDDVGTGNLQAFSENPGPMSSNTTVAAASKSAAGSPEENVLADENADNDAVVPENDKPEVKKPDSKALYEPKKKTNSTTTTNSTATTPQKETTPTPNKDAMFTKGAYGKHNNSTGDGTGGGKGDQGKPDGDPNSTSYLGNGGSGGGQGSGDLRGPGFSLAGRRKMNAPGAEKCNTPGRVVITVRVDKAGKVVEAKFKRFDSTVFEDCNVSNALAAARKWTFNAAENAPEIQEGTITFIYQIK